MVSSVSALDQDNRQSEADNGLARIVTLAGCLLGFFLCRVGGAHGQLLTHA